MRLTVFLLCGLYVVLYTWAWISTSTGTMDAAGRGMALGFLTVGIGVTVLFAVPALVLATIDRAPKAALILALAPAAAVLLAAFSGVI